MKVRRRRCPSLRLKIRDGTRCLQLPYATDTERAKAEAYCDALKPSGFAARSEGVCPESAVGLRAVAAATMPELRIYVYPERFTSTAAKADCSDTDATHDAPGVYQDLFTD